MKYINHEIINVSSFLNALKSDIKPQEDCNERFFRGLRKTDYIEKDFPSIYRIPEREGYTEYDPYIKYEDEMFYDLVSRFPEKFSSCRNTFEHLVMMQHYSFPTRLLDVTSNPLIALYFSCVDRYGNVNEDEDGIVTIYDIPKMQIKNYNSDTVTILSNLARISQEYKPFFSYFNIVLKKLKMLRDKTFVSYANVRFFEEILDELEQLVKLNNESSITTGVIYEKKGISNDIANIKELITKYKKTNNTKSKNENLIKIRERIEKYSGWLVGAYKFYPQKIDMKFNHLIKEDKDYFIHEDINPLDFTSFFCVKPKLNNPRIINQNGAFILVGFASKEASKITPPKTHFKARIQTNKQEDGIIIKKENKKLIHDELRQLGIHKAFVFPEIDNVSQVVVNNYTREKLS